MESEQTFLYELDMAQLSQELKFVTYHDGEIALVDRIVKEKHLHPLHLHPYCIVLCSMGSVSFNFNGKRLSLSKGQVVLTAPDSILTDYDMSDDFVGKAICLSAEIIHSLLGQKIGQWNLFVYNQKIHNMELSMSMREQYLCYYELLRFKMKHPEGTNRVEAMRSIIRGMLLDICSIIDTVQTTPADEESYGKVLFNNFLQYLTSSRVKHQPVSHYAGLLSITPKYLSMLCTKYSNKTASEWIRQYTKEDIRFHLCHTSLTLKEICEKTGFKNLSFFVTYVRKQFGMTPMEIRSQN